MCPSPERCIAPPAGHRPQVLALCRWFPPRIGGAENYLANLYAHVKSADVTVLAPHSPRDAEYDAKRRSYSVCRVSAYGTADQKKVVLPFALGVLRVLARVKVTQLHCGHIVLGVVALAVHAILGIPYVVIVHGSELTSNRLRRARSIVARRAAAVIVVSMATREHLLRLGVDERRVHLVPPGVHASGFVPDPEQRAALRRRLGVDGDQKVLLTVARLSTNAHHKGVDTVIQALRSIVDSRPEAHYLVVGDGDDLRRLQQLAEREGVTDRVTFLGEVSSDLLRAAYSAADLFVLPNRLARTETGFTTEGFGIVLLEAAAAGIATIASNAGGAGESVIDGETGLLLSDTSPPVVADAIIRLLSDDALRQRMGKAAQARAVSAFSWESAGARVDEVIAHVNHAGARRVRWRSRLRLGG